MSSNNGWSPERRQRQREAIQRWKPWEQSTGPRTPEGKAKAASKSTQHGLFDAEHWALLRWAIPNSTTTICSMTREAGYA